VPSDTAPLLEQFTSLLYSNISNDDLAGRNDSDVYGATLSLWKALNALKRRPSIYPSIKPGSL